mgnify:FL=1
MLGELTNRQVHLACGATDLRRGIDGLAVLVREQFDLDPFSSCLFVFFNRNRNKIKCLFWDVNGFWLLQRRIEKGRFDWPQDGKEAINISYRQLRWLMDGLSIRQNKAFKELTYSTIL